MTLHHCVIIILLATSCSVVHSQQKEQIVTKQVTMPDSLRRQYDTLIVGKEDEMKIRRGWSKLKKGMPVSQVLNFLGKPTKVEFSSFDESITWHYGKRSVVFDNIKQTLRYWEK